MQTAIDLILHSLKYGWGPALIIAVIVFLTIRAGRKAERRRQKEEEERLQRKKELKSLLDGRVVRVVVRHTDNTASWKESEINDLLIGIGVTVELVPSKKGNQIATSEDKYPKDGILIMCRQTHSNRMGMHIINCDSGRAISSSLVEVSEFFPDELASKAIDEIHAKLSARQEWLNEKQPSGKPAGSIVSI